MIRCTFSALFVLGATGAAFAQSLVGDFNASATNPNGQWSYGYRSSLAGSMTLFGEYVDDSTSTYWRTNLSLGAPAIFRPNAGPVNGVLAGEVALHGGPNGEFAVARYTVPGSYAPFVNLSGSFGQGDAGSIQGSILRNGVTLFSTGSTTATVPFSLTGLVSNPGDTFEIVVGTDGLFDFDSTPVQFNFTPVPEPMTLGILALGALAARRRKRSS